MATSTPANLLSREDVLLALEELGEDPGASRVDQLRARIDASTLAEGDRGEVIRAAVDAARQEIDTAADRKLPGKDTLNIDTQEHAKKVLARYSGDELVSDLYDNEEQFANAICDLAGPGFEYPDYSHLTVEQAIRKAEKMGRHQPDFGPVPEVDEFQSFLYDAETESGFIIRNEGGGRFKAEEWRNGDIADNAYGTYVAMEAWTEKAVFGHNMWRINSGYAPCTESRKLPADPTDDASVSVTNFRIGQRVFLADAAPVADGWYIVHRAETVSGRIETPDTIVTLCLPDNAPGDYVRVMASQLQASEPDTAVRQLPEAKPLMLKPSGRFITDDAGRKVAELFQPGDSPAEQELIKRRIVGSFNALPDLVGVLLRADMEGSLWQAFYNEGITDAYDAALADAVKALGEDGIAMVASRYELDPETIRAKLDPEARVDPDEPDLSPGM